MMHTLSGTSLEADQYVLITSLFRLASEEPAFKKGILAGPHLARRGFDRQDFHRLVQDPTVDLVYSNGEFEVYLARATGDTP